MTLYSNIKEEDSELFFNKLTVPIRNLLIPFLIDLPPEFTNFFSEIYELIVTNKI